MRAFFLLCLVAAAYGSPLSMVRPAILTDDIMRPSVEEPAQPIIIPVNPMDMTRPIIPNMDSLLNSGIQGEITRPTHIDQGIPSLDIGQAIELPAEIAPMVQIIINIKKAGESVDAVPQVPEPEIDSVMPLVPMIPDEDKPIFGVFPALPDATRPSQGINPDFQRPAVQAPVQSLELPINSMIDRPATSLIR